MPLSLNAFSLEDSSMTVLYLPHSAAELRASGQAPAWRRPPSPGSPHAGMEAHGSLPPPRHGATLGQFLPSSSSAPTPLLRFCPRKLLSQGHWGVGLYVPPASGQASCSLLHAWGPELCPWRRRPAWKLQHRGEGHGLLCLRTDAGALCCPVTSWKLSVCPPAVPVLLFPPNKGNEVGFGSNAGSWCLLGAQQKHSSILAFSRQVGCLLRGPECRFWEMLPFHLGRTCITSLPSAP